MRKGLYIVYVESFMAFYQWYEDEYIKKTLYQIVREFHGDWYDILDMQF